MLISFSLVLVYLYFIFIFIFFIIFIFHGNYFILFTHFTASKLERYNTRVDVIYMHCYVSDVTQINYITSKLDGVLPSTFRDLGIPMYHLNRVNLMV